MSIIEKATAESLISGKIAQGRMQALSSAPLKWFFECPPANKQI
jgi:hypothetical protein